MSICMCLCWTFRYIERSFASNLHVNQFTSLCIHIAWGIMRERQKREKHVSIPMAAKHKNFWLYCCQPQQKNFQLVRKWNWMRSFVTIIKTVIPSAEGKKPINLLLAKRIFHCFPQNRMKSSKTKCEEKKKEAEFKWPSSAGHTISSHIVQ